MHLRLQAHLLNTLQSLQPVRVQPLCIDVTRIVHGIDLSLLEIVHVHGIRRIDIGKVLCLTMYMLWNLSKRRMRHVHREQ